MWHLSVVCALSRYRYYVEEMVPENGIAQIREGWVDNVGYLLRVDRYKELTNAQVTEDVRPRRTGRCCCGVPRACF